MSRLGFALSMALLVAAAAWAYHVNYKTAEALDRVRALEARIAAERERLRVLEVEWARLTAPERLMRLLVAQDEALKLRPLRAEQFGEVAEIPYPPDPPPAPPESSAAPGPAGGAVPTAARAAAPVRLAAPAAEGRP